jgi:hypothetical protein
MNTADRASALRHLMRGVTPVHVFAALRDPARLARWWGPTGFTNTIDQFEFVPGGAWLLTMHGPDGTNYPNTNRFNRIIDDALVEIEHLNGHHFILSIALALHADGTEVHWTQTFDTAGEYRQLAGFLSAANAQNLERLEAEVMRDRRAS